MNLSVTVLCLSVREPISETTRLIVIINFLSKLPIFLARSSSGDVARRDVLPVLWMTSYLHIMGILRHVGEALFTADELN